MKLQWKQQKGLAEAPRQPTRPGAATGLVFVNIDSPEQLKDPNVQRKIRRQAMREIGKSRRREARQETCPAVPPPLSLVPVYQQGINICQHFRRVFFALGLDSDGALRLVMADIVADFAHRAGVSDSSTGGQLEEAMRRYTNSLEVVRARMAPFGSADVWKQVDRDHAIGTVICLAFYDMRVRNFGRWTMHMSGLERIVASSGGIEALGPVKLLRQALFMADVGGSLVFEARPTFPRPRTSFVARESPPPIVLSPNIATPSSQIASLILEEFGEIFNSMFLLAAQVNKMSPNSAQSAADLSSAIFTLAHDLLAIPGFHPSQDGCTLHEFQWAATREVIRQTALAFVSSVLTLSSDDDLYCSKHRRGHLRRLLPKIERSSWAGMEHLYLWVLVIGTLYEDGEDRVWLVPQALWLMRSRGLYSWDQVVPELHRIAWSNALATEEVLAMKEDILRVLHPVEYI